MPASPLNLDLSLFQPGQRIGVALSGGADSVALLLRMVEERISLGVSLAVIHVHHGIRGSEADEDAAFAASLAAANELPFHLHNVDVPAASEANGETIEEAARNLRYAFFQQLMADGVVDAVVTAHTVDDQAETVLHKLMRGAWTEGLSGIHPVVAMNPGKVLRPFLGNTREAIEDWLQAGWHTWREDSSNGDMAYTRNRIRNQLLPMLRTFNPRIAAQLARLAAIAGDEEVYWKKEMGRLLPGLLLPGRPVRGGGRSASTHPGEETLAMEQARLRELEPAVARRVLRAAARKLGGRINFDQTEQLLQMAGVAPSTSAQASRPTRLELGGGLLAARSPRELSLTRRASDEASSAPVSHSFIIPGEVTAPELGLRLRATVASEEVEPSLAVLRGWKAGDRVTIRHSRGPKKVSEILDRLGITGDGRKDWLVVESQGQILWMQGVDVDAPDVAFLVERLIPKGD